MQIEPHPNEFNYDILLRIFVNVTMYPQYNNIIIKLKNKCTQRYHFASTRMTIIKMIDNNTGWPGGRESAAPAIVGEI
jgi:hypothetical protein